MNPPGMPLKTVILITLDTTTCRMIQHDACNDACIALQHPLRSNPVFQTPTRGKPREILRVGPSARVMRVSTCYTCQHVLCVSARAMRVSTCYAYQHVEKIHAMMLACAQHPSNPVFQHPTRGKPRDILRDGPIRQHVLSTHVHYLEPAHG